MPVAKKRKRRFTTLRFRKNDPAHNLLAATQHWVRANGGELIVSGPIGVMEDGNPFAPQGRFRVVVGCLGRKPVKTDATTQKE